MPGDADPRSDLETLELELVLADLASVEGRLDRQRRTAKGDKSLLGEIAALERALDDPGRRRPDLPVRPLRRGARAARAGVPAHRQAGARGRERGRRPARRGRRARASSSASPVSTTRSRCACSSRPRRRCSTPKRATRCSKASGSAIGVVPRVARAAYHLLGRRTFLTTGDTENRARGRSVPARRRPECAGVIHSDLQRGFIRAEVIEWRELLEIGSWAKAQGARASCASKARTTSSQTATCSRSASTCDAMPGSCATVTCSRPPRSPTTARARRRGLLGPRRRSTARSCSDRVGTCTRCGCGSPSTSRCAT